MKKVKILTICIVILIVCCVFAQDPIQPIINFFLDLHDTPSTYTGQDGKVVKVDEANKQLIFDTESGAVEDDAYGAGWNGDTANAPSQNATYDILHQYDTDDDGDIDNIDGAVGGGDITGVGPGALAAGDALTDGYVTTGTVLFIWEGTTNDGNEFKLIVPEDPGSDMNVSFPTATVTLNAAGDITGTDAGTDLTADLEEEVTEGSLADSTIVSADIKNGEVALVDLAAAAYAKDIVTTSPITGGTNNVLVGADSDVTIAIGDADDDGATKGAASFDNTDFDAVAGNVTIVDDGHAHTTTSISGVDISADTNLAVGTGITLTDDTLTATEEDIEDFVGGMLGGTETDITVTYQDASNDIDFVVTSLVDIVTTSPLTVNAGANLDDVIVGSDADITIAIADADDDGATKGAASFDNTDFDAAAGNVTIVDDGHAHTGTSISGIDISADTNLTAGDHITLTDDDLDVDDDFLLNNGDVGTGVYDFGGTDSFELLNSAAPTTDATGEIALDTTITDHQPLWQYYDGGENMTIIAIDTAQLPALDNEIIKYDAGSDKFVLEADAGGGGGNDVYVEEGDAAKVDSSGADLYIDFDSTDFDVGVVGNEGNVTIVDDGHAHTTTSISGILAADMGDSDHGDVSWSGNVAYVEAATIADTVYASCYVGLFQAATGNNEPFYTDGALTYDATSGTLAATEFSGGGGSLTGIDAATGDSATAFFDAGTIEHEWGGLQADISGYTGLIAITGADTTAEIDSLDELEGQLADVTLIYTEAIIPAAGADPDVDAAGEFSIDTDGANEPNDVVLRSIDGGNTPLQIALAQQQKSFQATIIKPNDLANATRDACPIWSNETGMSFVVTKIEAWADTDDTAFNVEVVDADGAGNNATVDAVNCTTGTGPYTATETTITANTITANRMIFIDFDDTDDPGWVKISICGYFLSDVN